MLSGGRLTAFFQQTAARTLSDLCTFTHIETATAGPKNSEQRGPPIGGGRPARCEPGRPGPNHMMNALLRVLQLCLLLFCPINKHNSVSELLGS